MSTTVVSQETYGSLDNGQKVSKYTLTNENGVIIEVRIVLKTKGKKCWAPVICLLEVQLRPFFTLLRRLYGDSTETLEHSTENIWTTETLKKTT